LEFILDLDKLRAALPDLEAAATARERAAWALGAEDGQVHPPEDWVPGSWVSMKWIEGATGELAPDRGRAGIANMTPLEEVLGRVDYLRRHGFDEAYITQAEACFRRGYRPEALDPRGAAAN
jgi:hypothetical protein